MRPLLLSLVSLLLLGAYGGTAAQDARPSADEAGIRQAFDTYRKALSQRKGEAAAAVASKGTLAYYGRMRDMALRGLAATVHALPPVEKLMVLRTRQSIPLATLKSMSARQYFGYGVTKGWTGSAQVESAAVDSVQVDGDSATAGFLVGGRKLPMPLRFVREAGAWKVDLVALATAANDLFRRAIKQQGTTEDAFVLGLLEELVGKKVPAGIWRPLIR